VDEIYINDYNHAHIHVTSSDSGIEMEMSEFFKFRVPGYKFMPAFKRGNWDGFIKLYDTRTNLIYKGLFHNILEFANKRGYQIEYPESFNDEQYSLEEANQFIKTLNLPLSPRDYQVDAFISSVQSNRKLILSPTGSGKSLIIYLLTRYYNLKTLIIVPTTSLVHQMSDDFESYGFTEEIHKIYSGKDKESDKDINITTWQSIFRMPRTFFNQFEVVIVDEAHLAKSNSITKIMTNLSKCKYRFGFTGTLDGSQTSAMVLTGLFGKLKKVITTSELIENKFLADFKIKCIVLQYSDEIKKLVKDFDYQNELDYIVTHQKRNDFIIKLSQSLEGNTLLLFQFVEKHGKVLFDSLKDLDRPVYYIHGGIDGSERNEVRNQVESDNNAIIVASVGAFSTGINIKNLKNIIFASPSKSRIRTLQSIGRVLRKSETKTDAILFDIADNLSWKKKKNYTIIHFLERLKIYQQENFPYKIHNVEIK